MKTPRTRALLTTLALLLPGLNVAQDDGQEVTTVEGRTAIEVAALGPQIGERVPDFRLPDQHGQSRTLDSIMGPNGAMLLFHRSADW